jgi:hypothetical protein
MKSIAPSVLAIAVIVAGCGSGGSGESKADYIKRADAICLDATNKLRALGSPATPAQFEKFAGRAIPIVDAHLRQVRSLHPPKEIAAKANEVFDNVEQGILLVRRLATAARKPDAVELQKLASQAAALSGRTAAAARAVGFKQCGLTASL